MEDMKLMKNVAVLPITLGLGSWEISHWLGSIICDPDLPTIQFIGIINSNPGHKQVFTSFPSVTRLSLLTICHYHRGHWPWSHPSTDHYSIPYDYVLSITTDIGLPAKFDTLAIVSILLPESYKENLICSNHTQQSIWGFFMCKVAALTWLTKCCLPWCATIPAGPIKSITNLVYIIWGLVVPLRVIFW